MFSSPAVASYADKRPGDYVVEVRNLFKQFEDVKAINGVSFGVERGKMVTLLGPSGCGKTTILRSIAGLETITSGEIFIGKQLVSCPEKRISAPPEKRGVGLVFQSYAIWPHMSVFNNVAYPLVLRKLPKQQIRQKTLDILELVGLAGVEDRSASKLSGGQQQRVALARALVYEPELLLLDEPLSNLDAKLRESMRMEIVKLQKKVNVTAVYVTHDQVEAMALSDEVIVLNKGEIVQRGTGIDIYKKPANQFVCDFIGVTNFLEGTVVEKNNNGYGLVKTEGDVGAYLIRCVLSPEISQGAKVLLSLRPEDIQLNHEPVKEQARPNSIVGQITEGIFLGETFDYRIKVNEKIFRVFALGSVKIAAGASVEMTIDPESIVCLKA